MYMFAHIFIIYKYIYIYTMQIICYTHFVLDMFILTKRFCKSNNNWAHTKANKLSFSNRSLVACNSLSWSGTLWKSPGFRLTCPWMLPFFGLFMQPLIRKFGLLETSWFFWHLLFFHTFLLMFPDHQHRVDSLGLGFLQYKNHGIVCSVLFYNFLIFRAQRKRFLWWSVLVKLICGYKGKIHYVWHYVFSSRVVAADTFLRSMTLLAPGSWLDFQCQAWFLFYWVHFKSN